MKRIAKLTLLVACFVVAIAVSCAAGERLLRHEQFVVDTYNTGDFKLVFEQQTADLYVDESDLPGVARALGDLRDDIERVTGLLPEVKKSQADLGKYAVIAGTIGHSEVIDALIAADRLDIDSIVGKWEAYVIQVVANPLPNVDTGLVIAGSDRRGTIYGIYEISRQIGVSPWYFWADVTPEKQDTLVRMEYISRVNPLLNIGGSSSITKLPALVLGFSVLAASTIDFMSMFLSCCCAFGQTSYGQQCGAQKASLETIRSILT